MGLVLFSNDLCCENLAIIFMKIDASLFVYMYRNIKGLSAAIFVF